MAARSLILQRLARQLLLTLLLAGGAALLAGCGGGGSDNDDELRPVTLQFQGQVNEAAFRCGETYSDVGVDLPGRLRINDLRFYLYDLQLITASGERRAVALDQDGIWQYQNVAMVDLEDGCASGTAATNAVILGEVAAEAYRGVCFTLGVPYELNHTSEVEAPSPLNVSGMLWNWRGGRKFIRVDGIGDPGGLNVPFNVHLGSTQCPGPSPSAPPSDRCGSPNVVEVCLEPFDVDRDLVGVDLGTLLANSNVAINTPDTAPGCMSGHDDPECIEVIPNIGLDFTYLAGASTAPVIYEKATPQQLFFIIPR